MKATKLVTSTAVAVLGLTLLAPSVLAENGDAKVLTGNGDITYKEDTSTNPPTDPEKPTDPVDPPGVVNPDGGPLSIDFVGSLHFGEQNITTNEGVYYAAEADTTNEAGEAIKRGNWVQVTDKRAVSATTGESLGWKVKAQLTKQFTSGSSVLNGATLNYSNPVVTSNSDQSGTIDGITANNNVELAYDAAGTSTEMFSAAPGKGFGTYYVQYGREAGFGGLTEDTKTSANSIKLTVPANTPLAAAKYDAAITWTIEEL